MRVSARFAALAAVSLAGFGPRPCRAQQTLPAAGALDRFDPSAAGDAMFGVRSPYVAGKLEARGSILFDFADRPLALRQASGSVAIVSSQAILHVGASLALWDRLLIAVDAPFAVEQAGGSPSIGGTTVSSPSGAQVGDVRLGARVGVYGKYWDPVQIGIGGDVFVPSGPSPSYMGEGVVRGAPQLLVGGRFLWLVWNLGLGAMLRTSAQPQTFTLGAGIAWTPLDGLIQVGPEFTLAVPLSQEPAIIVGKTALLPDATTAAEVLVGLKARPFSKLRYGSPFVLGVAAGPGIAHAIGTPLFRAVGMIGYDPMPAKPALLDSDGDGIPDRDDACPQVPGVASLDPARNGCPTALTARDRDGDGIPDGDDACPFVPGVRSDDEKRNGCPPDRDGDGIADADDACPDVKGTATDDPKTNGCPLDTDHDGIPDALDACPFERGAADPDPMRNGCPKNVRVTDTEIVILRQVKFVFGSSNLRQTIDPLSDDLLAEVRDVIDQHPEIEVIEIQGHTDAAGDPAFNFGLSQARANAVRSWLVARGIPPGKLVVEGFGSTRPAADNRTLVGRQENRRVQFVIVKKHAK